MNPVRDALVSHHNKVRKHSLVNFIMKSNRDTRINNSLSLTG